MCQDECELIFKNLPRSMKLTSYEVRDKFVSILNERPPTQCRVSRSLLKLVKKWKVLSREPIKNPEEQRKRHGQYQYWLKG